MFWLAGWLVACSNGHTVRSLAMKEIRDASMVNAYTYVCRRKCPNVSVCVSHRQRPNAYECWAAHMQHIDDDNDDIDDIDNDDDNDDVDDMCSTTTTNLYLVIK